MTNMHDLPIILADDTDALVKVGIFIVILIAWGIKSLAGLAGKATEQQKERLRATRAAMEQAQRYVQQRQPPPPPLPRQLAPGVAMRVPNVRPARPARMPAQLTLMQRRASNPMAKAAQRPARIVPPALPAKTQPAPEALILEEQSSEPPRAFSHVASAVTVAAPAIRRWLTPTTLRQQFILTELFQAPIAMRENHLR
jgi:hypothetical protein